MKRSQSLFWPVLGVLLLAIAVGSLVQVFVVSRALVPLERIENRNRAAGIARDLARELAALPSPAGPDRLAAALDRHRAPLGRQAVWIAYRDAAGRLTVVPSSHASLLAGALGPHPVAGDSIVDSTFADEPRRIEILADGHRIVQVLENLLGNALRYVPPGGAVRVTLAPGAPGAEADGRHRLRVLDDGPGVPAADLPHLFERFYRGAATRNGDGRRTSPQAAADGTGLGLAIAREIVLGHGGLARAERREPHGLAVVVELPACAAPLCHGIVTALPPLPGTAEQEVTS